MVCGQTICGELIFSITGILDVNEAKTGKEMSSRESVSLLLNH
jgi:hypothetical protein